MDEDLRKLLQDALDELEEREWTFDAYGQESVCCRSCSASNSKRAAYGIPAPEKHDDDCSLGSVMRRLREKLGRSESGEVRMMSSNGTVTCVPK